MTAPDQELRPWQKAIAKETIGVFEEAIFDGALFHGPGRTCSWSPKGELSIALGKAVGREVTAHPWDPWHRKKEVANA